MSRENTDTRTRILEATQKLLETGEANAVRMADIAKRSGISRQAVYLHFPTRADLLIATTLYLDEKKDVDARLAESRSATGGRERLEAYIDAWGGYIPEIYGIAKALLAMKDSDPAAAEAWDGRMRAVRDGCAAAVDALKADGDLSADLSPAQATDLLWTLLSVRNWEHLTVDCGWPQARYLKTMKRIARDALVAGAER